MWRWCVWAVVAIGAAASAQQAPVGGAGAAPATLTISGPTGNNALTGAELASLPHHTATLENVHTHASETYAGVPLLTLLERVGAPTGESLHGKALSQYVVATGADGYKALLSLAEVEPDFHPGEVMVADTMDGKPMSAAQGPLKLVVSEDRRPARCVRELVKLELRTAE